MVESFERIGMMLLKEDSVSCLAYMRCLIWNPSDGLSLLMALDCLIWNPSDGLSSLLLSTPSDCVPH